MMTRFEFARSVVAAVLGGSLAERFGWSELEYQGEPAPDDLVITCGMWPQGAPPPSLQGYTLLHGPLAHNGAESAVWYRIGGHGGAVLPSTGDVEFVSVTLRGVRLGDFTVPGPVPTLTGVFMGPLA